MGEREDARNAIAANPPLLKAYEDLRKIIWGSGVEDAMMRYFVGRHIAGLVTDEGTYGKDATDLLGTALGFNKSVLSAYADVASAWSEEEFAAILDQRGLLGFRLTFSHFIAVMNGKIQKEERERLLYQALDKGLSVRRFAFEVKRSDGRPKVATKPVASASAAGKRLFKESAPEAEIPTKGTVGASCLSCGELRKENALLAKEIVRLEAVNARLGYDLRYHANRSSAVGRREGAR